MKASVAGVLQVRWGDMKNEQGPADMSAANGNSLDSLVGRGFKTIVADPPWKQGLSGKRAIRVVLSVP